MFFDTLSRSSSSTKSHLLTANTRGAHPTFLAAFSKNVLSCTNNKPKENLILNSGIRIPRPKKVTPRFDKYFLND